MHIIGSYLLFCSHRDVLTSLADDYGVELSKCQIVLLSQPDVMPDLDCPVADYAKQSLLIISPSRHLSVSLRPEVVSNYVLSINLFIYLFIYLHVITGYKSIIFIY